MRKHTPGRLLAYGLAVVAVAALAIAGAASGNHWADYKGTANSHELSRNPVLPGDRGRGVVPGGWRRPHRGWNIWPSGGPLVRIFDLNKPVEGTLSWALLPDAVIYTTSRQS